MGKEEKKSRSGGEERERDRDRERERERDRDRHKDKVRSSRDHRDRDRDRERDRDSRSHREHHREHRDRHRDRDRDRDRERERERDREHRDRKREREKREKSRDVDEEREGKRSRREDDGAGSVDRRAASVDRRAGSVDRRAGSVDRRAASVEVEEEDTEAKKAAEQKKLDEEMEKRRRRVQEWQELRRKKEEEERQNQGEQAEANGKTWTLEGDDSDEEGDNRGENGDVPMAEVDEKLSGDVKEVTVTGGAETAEMKDQEEELDPLDAFMNTMVIPEVQKLEAAPVETASSSKPSEKVMKKIRKPGGESDSDVDFGDDGEEENEEDDEEFLKRVKKTKAEKLAVVDHAKMQYAPFRKNFYKEVGEIQKMTDEDVAAYRKELELKVRGKDLPKPVKTWNQTGLKSKVLDVIKKLGFEKPMPIQAQALPIIMSGRDCIGIAKTGSGKTLAFVLPMLRHIKDQPPLQQGDGPIGLIMAPTRELVQQIYSDIKKFTRVIGLTCIPVYGGSGVAQQISELKRGAEIVVCTPGRMIDILCTSSGKITNLRRVTYLVMDEADRMFDLGFEPQITRIVQNARPDRQTVLFSATFPKQVELLARKVLDKPVEIQVGGRSVVNKDITQTVEVRPEDVRFLRLLELLGEWYEKGKVLVFVHTQDKCDSLFRDLLKAGYPCLSLHGAKDQTDRESTLSDFKSNVCNLLVATSVAARGLDVKDLELVVNYDVPNHYEDYVHRVGRTGRAGRKGHAVTFIAPDEDRYAPDLLKALELSEQPIPEDLKALADAFTAKVNQGSELKHGSGYGGSGFKFNEEEDEALKAAKKAQAKEYGYEEEDEKTDEDEEGDTGRKSTGDVAAQAMLAFKAAQSFAAAAAAAAGVTAALPAVPAVPGILPGQPEATAKALTFAKNLQQNYQKITAMGQPFEAELEINDYPQHARWKVTHKDALGQISDWTGAAITTRGQFFAPGKVPAPGERKLYLFIEGPSENSVKKAKAEIRRILEESTSNNLQPAVQPGKYSVL